MKTMKLIYRFTIFIVLAFSIISCDFVESGTYTINNQSLFEVKVLTSNCKNGKYDNGFVFDDSIHLIKPGETKSFIKNNGLCGINFYPIDYYKAGDTIPQTTRFDIYIANEVYQRLRVRKYWQFISEKYNGKYTLTITNELIDSLQKSR